MGTLRCLYMEDDLPEMGAFQRVIQEVWSSDTTLASIGQLEFIQPAHSPEEAIAILDKQGDTIDIFVADLLYRRTQAPQAGKLVCTGLHAVDHAAQHYPHIFIIAMSIAELEAEFADIKQDFLKAGGDVYFSKHKVEQTRSPRELYASMARDLETAYRTRLVKTGALTTDVRLDPREPPPVLDMQIETIGRPILQRLLYALVPQCIHFHIAHVDPGISGATVFKVMANPDATDQGLRRLLFAKVSRDAVTLNSELDRLPPVGAFPHGVCPEPITNKALEADGWFAIGYSFLHDATTVFSWLTAPGRTEPEVTAYLDRLWNALANYHRAQNPEYTGSCLSALWPSKHVVARTLVGLDELWPLAVHYLPAPDPPLSSDLLKDLLLHRRIGSREERTIPNRVIFCQQHGDFHAKNILVNLQSGAPHLVDFSHSDRHPWALDFATLTAYLIVMGVDSGVTSHDPSQLPSWRSTLQQWFNPSSTPAADPPATTAIAHAVRWALQLPIRWESLTANPPPIWQFKLALAFQLLRQSGHLDATGPKRALALVAAHDLLRSLETEIPIAG